MCFRVASNLKHELQLAAVTEKKRFAGDEQRGQHDEEPSLGTCIWPRRSLGRAARLERIVQRNLCVPALERVARAGLGRVLLAAFVG
jgi:hypothetical protein